MKIIGAEAMSTEQLREAVEKGARLVVFRYCISAFLITFQRGSNIYLVPAGESAVVRSLPFCLVSLLVGWWGLPWGPIFTIGSLITNLRGGKNVTAEVVAALQPPEPGGAPTYTGPANWWAK